MKEIVGFLLLYAALPSFIFSILIFFVTSLLILFNVMSSEQLEKNDTYIKLRIFTNFLFGITIYPTIILIIIYAFVE